MCQYLHEDAAVRNKTKYQAENTEKCDACKFDYFEKFDIKKHSIKKHVFYLCLQCDQTIEDKNILISKNFSMRYFLRKQFKSWGQELSSSDLDRLVKKKC